MNYNKCLLYILLELFFNDKKICVVDNLIIITRHFIR